MAKLLKISEVSKLSGVNIETIRYYEKIGVLYAPIRASNGYRMYDPHILVHLKFIKDCRSLGFSMEEIKQLDALRTPQKSSNTAVYQLVNNHLKAVQSKITRLQEIEHFLLALTQPEQNAQNSDIIQKLGGHYHDAEN